jgi:FlaA1/EpsC-like NDP-sugar epimerase
VHDATGSTIIIIGQIDGCRRLERQLDLLAARPVSLGWVVAGGSGVGTCAGSPGSVGGDQPILGTIHELEAIIARRRPGAALVTLPASMCALVTATRTRLRRLGVPDRFMPMLEDQLAGVGPRTEFDIDLGALLSRPPREIDAGSVRGVIEGRRVLITGAGGSIGSELSRIAAQYGPERLILVERSECALFEIDRQLARRHPELRRTALLHDVVDSAGTLCRFRELRPEIVFHAAAHKHVPMMEDHPAAAIDNNLFGTTSVADAADAAGAERFVMISTDKAVNPRSIMGATKRLAELYVQWINQRSETGFSMVRFGNVLGSSGSVLDVWSRQIREGGPLTVTDPAMTRYFMTIPEAAALVIQSAALFDADVPGGEVFVLDMGEPVRVLDLALRFIAMHGLEARLPDESAAGPGAPGTGSLEGGLGQSHAMRAGAGRPAGTIEIVFTGARPGEKLFEELAFDAEAMRPTRHPDINIWMIPPPDVRYIRGLLAALKPGSRPRDPATLAELIRRLIPEAAQQAAA